MKLLNVFPRVASFACIILLSAVEASESAIQVASSPTKLSASAELVLVPVVARTNGTHLAGLKKEEFKLLQDGVPQEIAVFEEVHTVAPPPKAAVASGEFSNTRTSEISERLTIIAIDTVNTAPMDQAYLKQELLKFLDTAAHTGEPFALIAITTSGVTVLQDFTTDKTLIASAVRSTRGNAKVPEPGKTGNTYLDETPCALSNGGCGGEAGDTVAVAMRQLKIWENLYKNEEEYEVFRDRDSSLDTLGSLQEIAQWLRGFPGRKTLIWAGSGIQWVGGMTRVMVGNVQSNDYSSYDQRRVSQALDANFYTFRVLTQANVAVYPLDARHNPNTSFAVFDVTLSDAPVGDRGFSGQRGRVQNDDQERVTMFQQIAAQTGGRPCFNRTDLANCLNEFATDSHEYYMLGFYVDKKTKSGWHTMSVKLDRKADLRYRNGFDFSPFDPEKVRLSDLQLAMMSPLPYTGLQFSGRFTDIEQRGPNKLVHFEVNVPPDMVSLGDNNDKLNFDVVAVARGSNGKEVAKLGQRIAKALQPQQAAVIHSDGVHYTNKLELPPGKYGLCIVVRDNGSGRTGSVTTTLAVN